MIRILSLLIFVRATSLNAQYFQQDIKYDIEAAYDRSSHQIEGNLDINYTNNSSNNLDTIYLHLWANAFSSKTNSYTDQIIKLGKLEYYFASKSKQGGYENINVTLNGKPLEINYKNSEQIAYILPDKIINSGEEVNLKIDYKLTMPYLFDRFGWKNGGVQLVHWYPSIAVYDNDGWHPMEYLVMGELYSTVAKYKVKLDHTFEKLISSGPVDGSGYTEDIVDFAVIANDKYTLTKKDIHGVEVTLLHNENKHIAKAVEVLEKILPWAEKHIGPYPHKTLAIVEKGKSGGMEYSGVVTLGAMTESVMEYYLVHELIHQWFYGSIVTNQREYAWLDEGFTTYYQQRYYDEIYGADYYTQHAPKVHGTTGGVPVLQKAAISQAYRAFDQPLCTHINNISTLNYGLNSYEVPARWIGHLEKYIGKKVFDKCMKEFYTSWQGKHPKPSDFLSIFESVSGKNLDWMFLDMPSDQWTVDYEIKKESGDNYSITNKSTLAVPYQVKTQYKNGTNQTNWMEGHISTSEVPLENISEISTIEIGPSVGLMDRNPGNNRIGSKSLKLVSGMGLDVNRYNELYAMPLLNYNTSDGITSGAAFYNSSLSPKKWKFLVAPQYGFKSKKLIGQAWTSYDHYLNHPTYRKLFFKLGLKSFNDQFVENFNSANRYVKIDPTVSLHFRHSPDSHKYSKLSLKYIYINNEGFSDEDAKSNILQLRYESFNFYSLGPSDISLNLEYQPYENNGFPSQHYLKLISSYKKSWLYSSSRKLSFRLFGSYHLINTRRNSSSYDKRITRGATALIQQGFNDYTYEESWYNRGNQQQGLWGKQISNYGGGFKTPLGSAYSIGQTNDLALALNFEADLPIKLSKFLPLGVYLDVGYYTTKDTESEDLTGNTLLSGGLALNYGEGLFSIYLPLYSNDPINSIYEPEGTNLLGKISFKIDINRFNPWEIIEDYNF